MRTSMNHIRYILAVAFVFSCWILQAQYYSFGQHVSYADECYAKKYYLLAVEHYTEAISTKGKLNPESLYRYADAAFNIYDLPLAESLFMQYLDNDKAEKQAEALANIIRIRQRQARYEETILDCNIYFSEYAEQDSVLRDEIQSIKESCQWVLAENRSAIVDSIKNLKEVNTAFSEQAPFLFGDSLIYSSLMKKADIDQEITYISRIYKSPSEEIVIEGLPENKFISHPAFSEDSKYMFYTVGDYDDNNEIICDIYFSFVEADSAIGIPRILPAPVNSADYSSTHPVIIPQDTLWHLYFSSNMPGGKGGFDIWKAVLSSDFQVSSLENMDALNTRMDEFAPYLDFNTNELYFSSNGYPGYGGFDIYRINLDFYGENDAENIGPIINSSYNDLFFRMNTNGSTVYFTSNRPGSLYLDSRFESCCYDIYEAEVTECSLDLLALVFDRTDNSVLDGTSLRVIDPESMDTIFEGYAEDNLHKIELDCNKAYQIETEKEGYDLDVMNFKPSNFFSFGRDNEMIRKIYLSPSVYTLDLSVFSRDTRLPLDSLDIVLRNLQSGEDQVLYKSTTNNLRFEVSPDSDYSVSVSRRGYRDTTEIISTDIGQRDINKVIYLTEKEIIRQAKVSLEDAIPVALYFDNDAPKAAGADSLSAVNYTDSYNRFYDKRGRYIYRYVNYFSGSRQDEARREISQFFDNNVKEGFDRYENFKNQLLLVLESGQKINIYLRGYASPVAMDDYNRALGRRRVDSVRKEFDEWNDGALLPYIQSGQLMVTERSFGEETSPKNLSDDPGRPYESIYSPAAALERRVEIDEINFNQY